MKTLKLIIGVTLIVVSSIIILLIFFLTLLFGADEQSIKFAIYSIIMLSIGIILLAYKGENNNERQEFEEYKRMKMQEREMLYRYKDARGTPIEEYTMDDRVKLIVYYDRLPYDYKKKLVDDADRYYRRYESDKYLNKK